MRITFLAAAVAFSCGKTSVPTQPVRTPTPVSKPAGKVKSVASKVKTLADVLDVQDLDGPTPAPAFAKAIATAKKPVSPYLAVHVYTSTGRTENPGIKRTTCEVGIRTAAGWYDSSGLIFCGDSDPPWSVGETRVELVTLAGRAPLIRVSTNVNGGSDHSSVEQQSTALCWLDAKNKPHCVAFVSYNRVTGDDGSDPSSSGISVTINKDGTIALDGELEGEDEPVMVKGTYHVSR